MVVGVLVEISNKNVDRIFEYNVPKELTSLMKIGIRVLVPFGRMELEGFVLEIKTEKDTDKELKDIINVVDSEIVLSSELLELGKWMSSDTISTLISCYQVMLPKALKAKNGSNVNIKFDTYYRINENIEIEKLNSSQEKIINYIREKGIALRKDLLDISIGSLNTLIKKNYLIEEKKEHYRLEYNDKKIVKKKLTDMQDFTFNSVVCYWCHWCHLHHTHTSHTHPHTHQHTSTARIASMAPMAPKQCHGSIPVLKYFLFELQSFSC